MDTEILLNDKKKEANYFYNFNFLKFKKILLPLAIIALLLVIKQFIINNFNITKPAGLGLTGIITPFAELPVWASTVNMIINILILTLILCWEAVYEKKYDKIKIVLLLGLPSTVFIIIKAYPGFYDFAVSNSFIMAIISILSYFPSYALYGAFRGKILYGKKINILGYLIGLIATVNINPLYEKLASILSIDEFSNYIYSYGPSIMTVFIPLSFFYFIFLVDAGFSFKNFIKMPSAVLLSKKKFTAHFAFLFTCVLSVHLYFTEYFSPSTFNYITLSLSSIVGNLYNLFRTIIQIALVYLLFSQLLLLQLSTLRRRPLWIYLLSFIPVINLFPLFLFFRKSTPLTNTEYFEIEDQEAQNRLRLQIFILLLITVCGIYKFTGQGLSGGNLILLIGIVILCYTFILFIRIGIWIILGILGLAIVYFLLIDIPSGLYYVVLLSYGAIALYNLHIAIFWTAEEWDEIEESIAPENIQEV